MSAPTYPPGSLPHRPGTYALILKLAAKQSIRVGRLGQHEFPAGFYVYLGSALGPGGLYSRLRRHIGSPDGSSRRVDWRPFWHIDYLRRQASVVEIWFTEQPARREHDWATLVRDLPGATGPVARFGASDCRCETHLLHFVAKPQRTEFQRRIRARFPEDALLEMVELR